MDDILEAFKLSAYKLVKFRSNLHQDINKNSFITPFERIFMSKGLPIYYVKYVKEIILNRDNLIHLIRKQNSLYFLMGICKVGRLMQHIMLHEMDDHTWKSILMSICFNI